MRIKFIKSIAPHLGDWYRSLGLKMCVGDECEVGDVVATALIAQWPHAFVEVKQEQPAAVVPSMMTASISSGIAADVREQQQPTPVALPPVDKYRRIVRGKGGNK